VLSVNSPPTAFTLTDRSAATLVVINTKAIALGTFFIVFAVWLFITDFYIIMYKSLVYNYEI
jgi:hypothetical protein